MDEDAFYNYALALMRDSLNATGRRIFFDLCAHSCYMGQDLHSAECWAQWYANATRLGNRCVPGANVRARLSLHSTATASSSASLAAAALLPTPRTRGLVSFAQLLAPQYWLSVSPMQPLSRTGIGTTRLATAASP